MELSRPRRIVGRVWTHDHISFSLSTLSIVIGSILVMSFSPSALGSGSGKAPASRTRLSCSSVCLITGRSRLCGPLCCDVAIRPLRLINIRLTPSPIQPGSGSWVRVDSALFNKKKISSIRFRSTLFSTGFVRAVSNNRTTSYSTPIRSGSSAAAPFHLSGTGGARRASAGNAVQRLDPHRHDARMKSPSCDLLRICCSGFCILEADAVVRNSLRAAARGRGLGVAGAAIRPTTGSLYCRLVTSVPSSLTLYAAHRCVYSGSRDRLRSPVGLLAWYGKHL